MCGGHTDRCRTSRNLPCSRTPPAAHHGARRSRIKPRLTLTDRSKEAAKLTYMPTGIRADLEADAPTRGRPASRSIRRLRLRDQSWKEEIGRTMKHSSLEANCVIVV